jgi:hypothetical protein
MGRHGPQVWTSDSVQALGILGVELDQKTAGMAQGLRDPYGVIVAAPAGGIRTEVRSNVIAEPYPNFIGGCKCPLFRLLQCFPPQL